MKPLDSRSMVQQMLVLEPGTEEMFDELAKLHNTVDSFDNNDHIDVSGRFFHTSYSFPGIVLSRDVILGRTASGLLVALGTIFQSSSSPNTARISIQVHPEYRRRGFGSKLLKHLLQRAESCNYETVVCRIHSFRNYAVHFAEQRHFSLSQILIKMRLDSQFLTKPSIIPTELNIREFQVPEEIDLWTQLQNAIFRDSPDYQPTLKESLVALTRHEGFDPNLAIIGEVNGTPVGLCFGVSIKSPRKNGAQKILQIQGLGLLPDNRGKGYGQALLIDILNRAYSKDYKACELLVDGSNIEAFGLYSKFGFKKQYEHLMYTYHL
jgi:mycothiol synthase